MLIICTTPITWPWVMIGILRMLLVVYPVALSTALKQPHSKHCTTWQQNRANIRRINNLGKSGC